MKKSSLFMFVFIFCTIFHLGFGQTQKEITSSSSTVVRYINDQQQYEYAMNTGTYGDNIGEHDNSYYGFENTYRSEYFFSMSTIPSNATITSAYIHYSVTDVSSNSYWFAIAELDQTYGYQALWDAIGNSQLLFADIVYGTGNTSSTQDLIDAVNSARSGGTLYLGAASQYESTHQSYGKLTLTLIVNYNITGGGISLTADNDFTAPNGTHGSITVDGVQHDNIPTSGYSITRTEGQNLSLGAVSPQNDNQSHQMIWHTGSINRSDWRRNGTFRWYDQTHTFQVSQDDDGKTYMANLRKNYAISRNDNSEFDNPIHHDALWYIVEQNSGPIDAPLTPTINNKLYNFSYWTDDFTASNSRSVTPNDNTTYTAWYKYKQHSNTSEGFSSSSQRKFVKTSEGYLHYVYESAGKVWYEMSTDGVSSWNIMNDGKPLNSGSDAKGPSIDYLSNMVLITYQVDNTVAVDLFSKDTYSNIYDYRDHLFVDEFVIGMDFSQDSYPIVCIGGGGYT